MTTNPSNVFIFTRHSIYKTKNVAYPEILYSYSRLKIEQKFCIWVPYLETLMMPDAIIAFENDYGNIPHQIFCGNVTLRFSSV